MVAVARQCGICVQRKGYNANSTGKDANRSGDWMGPNLLCMQLK